MTGLSTSMSLNRPAVRNVSLPFDFEDLPEIIVLLSNLFLCEKPYRSAP